MSVDAEDSKQGKSPPYVSFSTFKTCMTELKEHGVPNKIDRSVLTRFSGVTGSQLMTALRFLQLIDQDGKTTDTLHALANANGTEEWGTKLQAVLKKAYAPLFNINLETATPKEFSETFARAFPGAGAASVIKRCIAFFLPAASDAGIGISSRITKGKKPRLATSGTGARKRAVKPADKQSKAPALDGNGEQENPLPADTTFREQLLEKFPKFDPAWTDPIKTEWFKGFQQFMALTKAEPK